MSNETTDELVDGLETVAETETAYCRLCDEPVVAGADDWGEVLEALAEHGIEEHDLPEDEPWTNEMLAEESADSSDTGGETDA